MNFINNIKNSTLIICNKYVKENILKLNKLLPIKLLSINEFKQNYFFSYDENTIIYIIKKYNIRYEIAKEYIENLYYIEDKIYNNKKLDFLVSLKKDLIDNNLLEFNSNFKEYLKAVDIITYNIKIDKPLKNILETYNYKDIKEKKSKHKHKIYEFNTMEEEIHYVSEEISKLIDKGISPNKIKLMNVDESYYNTIERIFSLYKIHPGIIHKRVLNSYPIVKEFINLYKDNTLSESINKLDNNNPIYSKLIDIINTYIKYDNKDLIIYKLEHSYIESNHYSNEIAIIDFLEYPSQDDEYYFLIGFNEKLIPKYYTDTDYLSDNLKSILNIETSKELNKDLKSSVIDIITSTKNIIITYKLKDNKSNYYPSSLISNFEVEKKEIDTSITYSELYNKILLIKEYDNYIKYGTQSSLLNILNNNYIVNYNSFNNKYTKIDRVLDKLNLSYSKMQTYNKCAFRYYLSDILKLDIFEENFSTVIGKMVHYVLEKCLSNNNVNIEKYTIEFLKDKKFTNKELFFLEKYKNEIKELLNQILLEKNYSHLDNAMYEKRIDIDYGNNIHFVGIIDKILYYYDGINTYIALIDYKTGNDDISLKYLNNGINIQLPIYLYLSKELNFTNPQYVGFYLQKFNITEKDYRLVGYSNSNKDILSYLDNNYDNSKIIKGLKTLKDGSFSKTSKILSNEEIDNIKDTAEKIIKNTIDKIKNNEFNINPKIDYDKNISCEYCKFNDICFKRKEDEIVITNEENGGDINGIY